MVVVDGETNDAKLDTQEEGSVDPDFLEPITANDLLFGRSSGDFIDWVYDLH